MEKIKIDNNGSGFFFWLVGWLFTIGFLQLPFVQGVLAIVIWPYYLGVFIRGLV